MRRTADRRIVILPLRDCRVSLPERKKRGPGDPDLWRSKTTSPGNSRWLLVGPELPASLTAASRWGSCCMTCWWGSRARRSRSRTARGGRSSRVISRWPARRARPRSGHAARGPGCWLARPRPGDPDAGHRRGARYQPGWLRACAVRGDRPCPRSRSAAPGEVTFPLDRGLPEHAWLWLKNGTRWLDYRSIDPGSG